MKNWKKPSCTTLMARDLSAHITVAAWSEPGICTDLVLR